MLGLFIGLLLVIALALPTAVLAEESAAATEAETGAEEVADQSAAETDTSPGQTTPESNATAIEGLISTVEGLNLQQGIENSLDTKLQNAKDSLTAANAGLREDAANKLQAFVNACEAQRDKALTTEQADELIADANVIIASL